jgi:CHAT domain-containing protein
MPKTCFRESRIFVLATHGLLSNDEKGFGVAALVLSDLVDGKEDGFLSASQIYSYKIGAGFVILSACNTGTPGAASGNSELASAFFYAGADQLMLTYWEIGSGAAVELMTQFAIDFRVDESLPADSLRAAIDGILANPKISRFHHPRFWASHFIIS